MIKHTHPHITSPSIRAQLAAELWSRRIDWHIVSYWPETHAGLVHDHSARQIAALRGKTNKRIVSKALRSEMAKRLSSVRHIIYWRGLEHRVIASDFVIFQSLIDSGAYLGREF